MDALHDLGKLHLNMSGCINACGHHHSGHIGVLIDKRGKDFYQRRRRLRGHQRRLPARIATIIGPAVEPEQVLIVIQRLVDIYRGLRRDGESFIAAVERVGVSPSRRPSMADEMILDGAVVATRFFINEAEDAEPPPATLSA